MTDKESESKTDRILDAIFSVLPAASVAEILRGVRRQIRDVSDRDIRYAISRLRRHSKHYGWTIPHVGGSSDTAGRYFALLIERDGEYYFDKNPENTGHLRNGTKSITKRAARQMDNLCAALLAAAQQTRRRNEKAALEDLAHDVSYVARKARSVSRGLEDDREAA